MTTRNESKHAGPGTVTRVKIVWVGDHNVGKTVTLISWTTNAFAGEYVPDILEPAEANVVIDGRPVCTLLVDTCDREGYEDRRLEAYGGTGCVVIAFSVDIPSSLDSVREKWAPEVRRMCGFGVPIVLAALKEDMKNDPAAVEAIREKCGRGPVTKEEGAAVGREIGAVTFEEVSALSDHGIKITFDAATRAALGDLRPPKRHELDDGKRKVCSIC